MFCETLDRRLAVYSCAGACGVVAPAPLVAWTHGCEPFVRLAPQQDSTRCGLLYVSPDHVFLYFYCSQILQSPRWCLDFLFC